MLPLEPIVSIGPAEESSSSSDSPKKIKPKQKQNLEQPKQKKEPRATVFSGVQL